MFQLEVQFLKTIFGDEIIRFEHYGSREYLRSHPVEVAKYSRFKEELAARFQNTSEYCPAKKTFVKELEQQALPWLGDYQQKLGSE
jgi:GrpB-like predicted nucleotidyltransferase (UPF0157 family)